LSQLVQFKFITIGHVLLDELIRLVVVQLPVLVFVVFIKPTRQFQLELFIVIRGQIFGRGIAQTINTFFLSAYINLGCLFFYFCFQLEATWWLTEAHCTELIKLISISIKNIEMFHLKNKNYRFRILQKYPN